MAEYGDRPKVWVLTYGPIAGIRETAMVFQSQEDALRAQDELFETFPQAGWTQVEPAYSYPLHITPAFSHIAKLIKRFGVWLPKEGDAIS